MTVSNVVRNRLDRAEVATRRSAVVAAAPTRVRPLADYLQIARRDLFAQPSAETGVSPESRRAPSTLRLLGTGRRGARSYAIVEDTQAKRQDVFTIGEKIGDAEVVEISYRRVVLERSGEREVLVQASDNLPGSQGATTSAPPVTQLPSTTAADDQIKRTGEDRYLIARAEVDHSMENLSDLFTQVRAVPNIENGKTTGFRLFSIRPGSLFEKIGLANNDVVQRVNGVELTDPAKAMTLFQDMQGQTRLTVDVLRGSDTRTFSYEIR
jgi:general secretion pathway protein C